MQQPWETPFHTSGMMDIYYQDARGAQEEGTHEFPSLGELSGGNKTQVIRKQFQFSGY